MSDLNDIIELLEEAKGLLEKTYSEAGVTSTSGFSDQMGSPSAEVLLTDGVNGKKKKKKFLTDRNIKKAAMNLPVADAPDVDAEGIKTTANGKKIKVTGLTDKQKDQYLFGLKEVKDKVDGLVRLLAKINAPEIEDEEDIEKTLGELETLEKCDYNKTFLIKGKIGAWRRVGGRPVFICKEGVIHAGPKPFIGKKVATLRDELRAEKKAKKSKKSKKR